MKTHSKSLSRRAFTLIELLVVIGIIALLAGLSFPAISGVMKKAKRARCAAAIKDIQLGIKNYQVEYNRYPLANSSGESPVLLSEGSPLLNVLLGKNLSKLNPREIVFLEAPMGKSGAGGLVGSEGSYGLTDVWGSPYEVIIDSNYDNKIANPDSQNSDETISGEASQSLVTGVAVYSIGEDKQANTKDDIVSWRP
jgi:prepilin-type N-terminal cleavage/methylation domain-containing protein